MGLINTTSEDKRVLFSAFSEGNDSSINTIRLLEHLGIKDRQSSRYEEYKWFSRTVKRASNFSKYHTAKSNYMISFEEFWGFLVPNLSQPIQSCTFDSKLHLQTQNVDNLPANVPSDRQNQKKLSAIQRYQKQPNLGSTREAGHITSTRYREGNNKENFNPSAKVAPLQASHYPASRTERPRSSSITSSAQHTQILLNETKLQPLSKLRPSLFKEGSDRLSEPFHHKLTKQCVVSSPPREEERREFLRVKITQSIQKINEHLARRESKSPLKQIPVSALQGPWRHTDNTVASSRTDTKLGFRRLDSGVLGYTSAESRTIEKHTSREREDRDHVMYQGCAGSVDVQTNDLPTERLEWGSLACVSKRSTDTATERKFESRMASTIGSGITTKRALPEPTSEELVEHLQLRPHTARDSEQGHFSSQVVSSRTTKFPRAESAWPPVASRSPDEWRQSLEKHAVAGRGVYPEHSKTPYQDSDTQPPIDASKLRFQIEPSDNLEKIIEEWTCQNPNFVFKVLKPLKDLQAPTLMNLATRIAVPSETTSRCVALDKTYIHRLLDVKPPSNFQAEMLEYTNWRHSAPDVNEDFFVSFNEKSFRHELHKVTTTGSLVPLAACSSLPHLQMFGDITWEDDLRDMFVPSPERVGHRKQEPSPTLQEYSEGLEFTDKGQNSTLQIPSEETEETYFPKKATLATPAQIAIGLVAPQRGLVEGGEAKERVGQLPCHKEGLWSELQTQHSQSLKKHIQQVPVLDGLDQPEGTQSLSETVPYVGRQQEIESPAVRGPQFGNGGVWGLKASPNSRSKHRKDTISIEMRRRTVSNLPDLIGREKGILVQRRKSLIPELDLCADRIRFCEQQRIQRARRLESLSSHKKFTSLVTLKPGAEPVDDSSPQAPELVTSPVRIKVTLPEPCDRLNSNQFFRLFLSQLQFELELHNLRKSLFEATSPKEAVSMICVGPTISCATLHKALCKLGVSISQKVFTQFWSSRFRSDTILKSTLATCVCGTFWKSDQHQPFSNPSESTGKARTEVKKLLAKVLQLLVASEEQLIANKSGCTLAEIIDFVRCVSSNKQEAVQLQDLQSLSSLQPYPQEVLQSVFERFKANGGTFPLNAYSICIALS